MLLGEQILYLKECTPIEKGGKNENSRVASPENVSIYGRINSKIIQNAGLPRLGKNIWKMNFFQVREKSGNFVSGQGNLERTWKVREKLRNLKLNDYSRQSSENLFILFKRGKDVHSQEIV